MVGKKASRGTTERVRHTYRETDSGETNLVQRPARHPTRLQYDVVCKCFILTMLDMYSLPGACGAVASILNLVPTQSSSSNSKTSRRPRTEGKATSSIRSQLASSRNTLSAVGAWAYLTGLAYGGMSVVCMKGEGCCPEKLLAKQRWIWCKPAVQDAHGLYRTWPYTVF